MVAFLPLFRAAGFSLCGPALLSRLLCLWLFALAMGCGAATEVRVATLDYPPYVSPSLAGSGWAWQVAEAAFAAEHCETQLLIYPWLRALHEVRALQVDALYLANKTPEREAWAYFSDPVGREDTVLWRRRDSQLQVSKVEDLKGLVVGSLRGSSQFQYLQQQGIELVGMNDVAQGIKMLSVGRLDVFVVDKLAAQHLLKSMPVSVVNSIEYVWPALYSQAFYLAIAKHHAHAQAIIETFNRGLRKIKHSGRYQAISQGLPTEP